MFLEKGKEKRGKKKEKLQICAVFNSVGFVENSKLFCWKFWETSFLTFLSGAQWVEWIAGPTDFLFQFSDPEPAVFACSKSSSLTRKRMSVTWLKTLDWIQSPDQQQI